MRNFYAPLSPQVPHRPLPVRRSPPLHICIEAILFKRRWPLVQVRWKLYSLQSKQPAPSSLRQWRCMCASTLTPSTPTSSCDPPSAYPMAPARSSVSQCSARCAPLAYSLSAGSIGPICTMSLPTPHYAQVVSPNIFVLKPSPVLESHRRSCAIECCRERMRPWRRQLGQISTAQRSSLS